MIPNDLNLKKYISSDFPTVHFLNYFNTNFISFQVPKIEQEKNLSDRYYGAPTNLWKISIDKLCRVFFLR